MERRFILVVGGAGFIGSHMVLLLKQAGYIPIVFDNLIKGHRDHVIDAELIVGDLADQSALNHVFSSYPIFAVMHFASYIEVAESLKEPLRYYQNNVVNTLHLLEVMLKNKVNHFIFSSSASIYGDVKAERISEKHLPAPITPYGRTKWMMEEIIKDIGKSHGLHYAILRYFNAAGADPLGRLCERHEPESHLIPIILQVALGLKNHVTIFGDCYPTADGTCVRDYVHVVDLCQAHLLAMQFITAHQKNIICNLGSGHGFSVLEVIQAASRLTGKHIPFIKGDARLGDPPVLVADTTLASETLQWQPQYSNLETILTDAWNALTSPNAITYSIF